VVVDEKPYSTPPLTPMPSASKKLLGKVASVQPR